MAEDFQIDHRVTLRQFPNQERDKANQRDNGQHDNAGRGKPVMVFTFIEHDLQGRHPYHQQNQPHHVDR
jgi:hypothetical protein